MLSDSHKLKQMCCSILDLQHICNRYLQHYKPLYINQVQRNCCRWQINTIYILLCGNRMQVPPLFLSDGKFDESLGIGKRIYRANNIRAKLPQTVNCWTGMCYFVKNVMKFFRELLHTLFFCSKINGKSRL